MGKTPVTSSLPRGSKHGLEASGCMKPSKAHLEIKTAAGDESQAKLCPDPDLPEAPPSL